MAARLLLVRLAVAELGPSFAALQFKRRALLGANCATCRSNSFSRASPRPGPGGSFVWSRFEKLRVPAAIRSLVAGPNACWVSAVVFAIAMWLWHEPSLYDATFQSTLVYWTMHISMIGAAVLFGMPRSVPKGSRRPSTLDLRDYAANEFTGGHFHLCAHAALFGACLDHTPWDMSPSEDQRLGGLITWVIGGAILAAWGILALLLSVKEKDETDAFEREGVRARARVG